MPRTPVPAPLVAAARRLDAWRSRRTRRVIAPEHWREAAELARRYGVHATARALRLNYYALRRRVAPAAARASRSGTPVAAPAFVQIGPSPSASECVIELEGARGTKLRVHLKGGVVVARDLAAFVQLLLGRV